jgi:predicted Zn-ribbon and HTH transcriptional regulator
MNKVSMNGFSCRWKAEREGRGQSRCWQEHDSRAIGCAGFFDDIMAASLAIRQSETILARSCEAGRAMPFLNRLISMIVALRFPQASVNVRVNMIHPNGELLPQPDPRKPKGNYTGQRLKALRPQTYRRVMELLAEPREHVSIREICRQCRVTDDTVKAVEKREAMSIAARKQELAVQAARIAKLAYDRVEDQIGSASLPQATVTAGVFTDKSQLLSSDVTARAFNVNLKLEPIDIAGHFNRLHAELREKLARMEEEKASTKCHQLALPSVETTADSGAETDLRSGKENLQKLSCRILDE